MANRTNVRQAKLEQFLVPRVCTGVSTKSIPKVELYMAMAQQVKKRLSADSHAVRKLSPTQYPIILIDVIREYDPHRRVLVALKNVTQNETIFLGHFPHYPVFPGALIIEALAQTCGILMASEFRLRSGVPEEKVFDPTVIVVLPTSFLTEVKVKVTQPVFPGDQMELNAEVEIQREKMFYFRVYANVKGVDVAKGHVMLATFPSGELLPGTSNNGS